MEWEQKIIVVDAMNSFDEIQCEESAEYQLTSMEQELAEMEEWLEERDREIQQELDEYADKLFAAEIDF